MSALTTVKLVLLAIVLVTAVAGLLLSILAAAFREEERSFPQIDESGR